MNKHTYKNRSTQVKGQLFAVHYSRKKKTLEFILQSEENGKVLLLVLPDLFNKPLTNGKLIRSLDKRLLCRISEAWRFYALAGRLMTDDLNFEAATKRLVRLCSLAERTKERMEGARGWG